jgi:hypothetical protein
LAQASSIKPDSLSIRLSALSTVRFEAGNLDVDGAAVTARMKRNPRISSAPCSGV